MQLQLLDGATATSNEPTAATDGVEIQRQQRSFAPSRHDRCLVSVFSTAGTGVLTATIRLWGYATFVDSGGTALSKWLPVWVNDAAQPDAVTDAKRGVLHAGVAIGELDAGDDFISFSQEVAGLRHFTRLYAQVVAIGGTNTAVDVWVTDRE
jgi:hypothetical protein